MKKTKRILSLLLCTVLLLVVVPLESFSVSAVTTYDPNKALEYARAHWNDGKGLCAEFVSDCLQYAGFTEVYNVNAKGLGIDLQKYGQYISYNSNNVAGIAIKASNFAKPLSAGDIIIWVNKSGSSSSGHAMLYSGETNSSGTVLVYAHNTAKNKGAMSTTNTAIELYAIHLTGHSHNYSTFIGYGNAHPHYAIYQCSCGATTTTSSTTKLTSCLDCEIPTKPILEVWAGADTEDTILKASYYGETTYSDYRIWDETGTIMIHWGQYQTPLYAVQLPAGNYKANLCSCSRTAESSIWWKESDFVTFTVGTKNDAPVKTITFNGHIYEMYLNRLSWDHAEEFCESKGGHLATITSAKEQQTLFNAFSGNYLFIGGTDREEEGVFKWVTGELFTYTHWNSGNGVEDPNNYSGHDGYRNENVMAFQAEDGYWCDCVDKNMYVQGFICEYEHTHEYTSAVTTAATCTENGVMTYTCSCGDSYTEVIPAHHIEQIIQSVNATCTEGGYDLVKCAKCGVRYKINETPALEHHHIFDHTVDPTCEEKGYDVYKCERCDDCYYDNYQDAIGHDYHQTRTVAATCVKEGYYIYTCAHCEGVKHQEITALGHYFVGDCCVDCGVSKADAPFEFSGDGKATADDLVILKSALLSDKTKALFDVNGDNTVDVRDLVRMKKHFAK